MEFPNGFAAGPMALYNPKGMYKMIYICATHILLDIKM